MTKIWGPSSARRISFGSPTSRTNCTPIRRFQKWMNLLQVINFVIWWCIFEILFCLEAQYQGDSWNCCEVISNLQDELRMDNGSNVLDQLHNNSIYLNGRISYRWWFWLQMKINVCTRAWILSEVFPKKPLSCQKCWHLWLAVPGSPIFCQFFPKLSSDSYTPAMPWCKLCTPAYDRYIR